MTPPSSSSTYQLSRWLPFSIRLLSVGFVLFFSSAFLVILLGLDKQLLSSDVGQLIMSVVRWGDQSGGGEHYELMICITYVVWGFFLWYTAADPLEHKMFLDFTVAANVAHFGLMFLQGLFMHGERIHLVGDIALCWAALIPFIIFWLPARAHAR